MARTSTGVFRKAWRKVKGRRLRYIPSKAAGAAPTPTNVYVRVAGAWVEATNVYVRVAGAWVEVVPDNINVRVGGAWVALTSTGGGGGSLPLAEEFTGSSINTANWTVYNRLSDQANNEVNAVIPGNVRVSGGSMFIDQKFEDVSAGDTTTGAPNPRTVHYTSGQVAQAFTPFLYGTVDVRAKIPGGTGNWPCIWMLGENWQASQPDTANVVGHDWPNGGWWECDIAEFMNGNRSQVNCALHFNGVNVGGSGEKSIPFDATTRFMVYRLVWTATSMTWYVDAEDGNGFVQKLQITGAAGTVIPNTAAYLVIHCAIGGTFGGTPNSSTYPTVMEIDYAHITQ